MKTKIIVALLLLCAGVTEAQLSFNKFLGIKVSANNTLVGVSAGSAVTTGTKNTYLGRYTGVGRETLSNQIVLSDGDGNVRAINNAGNWLIGKTVDEGFGLDVAGTMQVGNMITAKGGLIVKGSLGAYLDVENSYINRVASFRYGNSAWGLVANGLTLTESGTYQGGIRITANTIAIGNSAAGNALNSFSTILGAGAANSNITGTDNVTIGWQAAYSNPQGGQNVAIGVRAGSNSLNTASSCVYIGHQAGASGVYGDGIICIGANSNTNGGNTTVIGNSSTLNTRLYGSLLIGQNTAVSSAIATFSSTTQGVLLPRLTTAQINAIVSPVAGLMVYNTDLAVLCFYDGTGWRKVSHSSM